jgi:hypothetical protein
MLIPNICRLFAKNIDVVSLGYHVMPGTGGYGFIYTILLLLPFAIDMVLYQKQDKILRFIATIFLITSIILLFKAAYFMALLLTIINFFLYFYYKFPKKMKNKQIILFIIIIMITYIFLDDIIDIIIQFIPIRSIQAKMLSFQAIIRGTEEFQDSEFTTRGRRYAIALLNTIISPLFGWFTYRRGGNHSHLLDFSAQYGIPFLYGYIQIILNPLRKNNAFNNPATMTCFILLSILLLFNALAFSWGGVVFIFIPLYCKLIANQQNISIS